MVVIFGLNSCFTYLGLTDDYDSIYNYTESSLNMMVNNES